MGTLELFPGFTFSHCRILGKGKNIHNIITEQLNILLSYQKIASFVALYFTNIFLTVKMLCYLKSSLKNKMKDPISFKFKFSHKLVTFI